MLKRIEEQLKRIQEGEDYGSYSCGAYFLSGKQESSLLAANTYRALMVGEGSSVESGAINSWSGIDEPEKIIAMKQYLKRFVHPIFAMPISDTVNDAKDFITYTPGTSVSGLELPLHLGLPTKSVYGLPVIEHAEFGRNVTDKSSFTSDDKRKIEIGKIYNMGQIENKSTVEMNVAGLTAHTFITGSTGSGKSNTIYQMLSKLDEQEVHFLVVEPAKGEYKDKKVFGSRADVTVYGTNRKIAGTDMLRINPFSFPENVHVLEHLDRLVEIFNVCWPMYAAMPAILKDSIQRAYEVAGWNVETSENKYDNRIFPTFSDVYKQIRKVLDESEYSQDNKGDYTGSLVTRLKSLTNGINGLIFTPDEISATALFDTNVIVDLSRIGSIETKSLIMGLLVLKLQEHRMNAFAPNQKLHHITVLEEAHNLLRRTSTEQTSEGSNLLGKSVEMLANSIAEMRTYGEGFIIADQSPGLLDMSVIRNTNTKIILRLPDYSDRELVGRAAGLNDEQIVELAKLDNGVAAIKQSEWLEAVLCKVDKFEPKDSSPESCDHQISGNANVDTAMVSKSLLECIMNKELYRKGDRVDIQKFKELVLKSKLDAVVKCEFIDYISVDVDEAITSLRKLIYEFVQAEDAIRASVNFSEVKEWANAVIEKLNPSVSGYSKQQMDLLMALIIFEKADRDSSYNALLCRFTEMYRAKGGVI
ncbi:ATP-binding protein [Clostridium beijerinckii]|nr:ATP-binding protein [Clostridium beijerinckii]